MSLKIFMIVTEVSPRQLAINALQAAIQEREGLEQRIDPVSLTLAYSSCNISPEPNHLLRQWDFGFLQNRSYNRKQQSGKNGIHIERPQHFFVQFFNTDIKMSSPSSTQKVNQVQTHSLFIKNHLVSHWTTG